MSTMKSLFTGIALLGLMLLLTQCEKGEGEVAIRITDAPSDDANVEAVFITITDVKIDGKSFSGFSGKQTLEITNWTNGNAALLGLANVKAGSYSNVTLLLDYETDATGNAPGCYVKTVNGAKHDLASSLSGTGEIVINKAFNVKADAQSSWVFDFDVRKCIKRETNGSDDYEFVTNAEMSTYIRAVVQSNTATVSGSIQENVLYQSDKAIAYLYEKGTLDVNAETQGQGSSNVMFANAVSSSELDANGDFNFAFIEEGEYELICIAYDDADNDGRFEIEGQFELMALLGLSVLTIDVQAGVDVSLSAQITGLVLI